MRRDSALRNEELHYESCPKSYPIRNLMTTVLRDFYDQGLRRRQCRV